MSNHVVRPDSCTPAGCPAYFTHARQRFQWASIKFLLSPTERNRSALLALLNAQLCDSTTRSHQQAEIQPEEQIA